MKNFFQTVDFLNQIQQENWEVINKDMQLVMKKRWVNPLQKIIDDCPDFSENRETFVSVQGGEIKFNPIARKIGEEVYQYIKDVWDECELGSDHKDFKESSLSFMRLIFYSLKFGPSDGRVLDFCWNGIGFWKS